MTARRRPSWWYKHSLTLVAGAILILWIVLYARSSPATHAGSFFGNAIADWTGLVVMALATEAPVRKGFGPEQAAQGHPARPHRGIRTRTLADHLFPDHRCHVVGGVHPHGCSGQMGTGGRQHRLRVDADPGTCAADQEADGDRFEGQQVKRVQAPTQKV